jgi:hypothetical protein
MGFSVVLSHRGIYSDTSFYFMSRSGRPTWPKVQSLSQQILYQASIMIINGVTIPRLLSLILSLSEVDHRRDPLLELGKEPATDPDKVGDACPPAMRSLDAARFIMLPCLDKVPLHRQGGSGYEHMNGITIPPYSSSTYLLEHTAGCLFSTVITSIYGYSLDPVQTLLPII